MNKPLSLLLTLLSLLVSTNLTFASDKAKEQRWADQYAETLIDGEIIRLGDKHDRFNAILTEADDSQNAAIIVHGTGIHPNWPQVIYPLRTGLPDHGWTTLSIQMPVLPNDAKTIEYADLYDEAAVRINLAIKDLRKRDYKKIVIIAHSLGASMAVYFQSKHHAPIDGLIGIGMSAGGSDKRMDDAWSLARIHIPVLDLFGEHDLEGVLNTREERQKAAIKAKNIKYSQQKISGADHFFEGLDDELIKVVSEWLEQSVP